MHLTTIETPLYGPDGRTILGKHIQHPDHTHEIRQALQSLFPDYAQHVAITKGRWDIRKFHSDEHAEAWKAGDPEAVPYEHVSFFNGFLNSGINEIWELITDTHTNWFNNTNSQIGVGDSATAFSATQTDLQATTNKTYQAADSGYPTLPGSQNILFQATFGGGAANYAWNEVVIKNNASAICIDRAVQSLGTKASGTSWVAQVTLSMS